MKTFRHTIDKMQYEVPVVAASGVVGVVSASNIVVTCAVTLVIAIGVVVATKFVFLAAADVVVS